MNSNTAYRIFLALLILGLAACPLRAESQVTVERLPEGGVQPQSFVDAAGTVHLVYLTGEARASEVVYTSRKATDTKFAPTIRINTQPGSAVAAGTIRGAQLGVGEDGTVHVLWNGSQTAMPKQGQGSPLLYARKLADSAAFEPERNLMGNTYVLDGGGSLAAGKGGQVYVAWHASKTAQPGKETDRAAFLAVSSDGGKTFAPEREISPPKSGSCACCGLRLAVDGEGAVNVLFRAAFSALDRDLVWLKSKDQGQTFTTVQQDSWKIGQCPMSSAWLRDGWAGWEVNGQVKFTSVDGTKTFSPPGDVKRKHPAAVQTKDGSTLLIWTEGTGWQKGGSVVWQVIGPDGKPTGAVQKREGLPVWGLATAWAEAKGGWVVLY
ncbi:MAG: hypothetical protein K0Q55_3243 [Verrucomicrobia bacterium]|nr:hypothetical protein [Verrucomicrobiota bacterium]